MKSLSNDTPVSVTWGAPEPREGLNLMRMWPSTLQRLDAVQFLSSVALVILLSACGGGDGGTFAAPALPLPSPSASSNSISGNVRAPGGRLSIGISGTRLAGLDASATDREPVMTAATQPVRSATTSLLPSVLRTTTPRKAPTGFSPISRKLVVLRELRSFGPTYGPPLAQATTDGNGGYSINLPNGTSPTAVLIITVGVDNEVPMSAIVTSDMADVDPVTEAAFQVIANYARSHILSSISLDLAAELVAKIDDIAASMPTPTDSRGAADAYVHAAAGSAAVNASLTAQLASGGTPIGGSGGTPVSGAPIVPGQPPTPPTPSPTPSTPPTPNSGSTGTWYAHFTLQLCDAGDCFSQRATAPGNNAYDSQASCLEGGRQTTALLNTAATAVLTYDYFCNQTP